MADLAARISALATAIGNSIRDTVLPRLLPAGGTAGQVLAKSSATNYATGWQTIAGGSSPWVDSGTIVSLSNRRVDIIATDATLLLAGIRNAALGDYAYAGTTYGVHNPAATPPTKELWGYGAEAFYPNTGAVSGADFYIYNSMSGKYNVVVDASDNVGIGGATIWGGGFVNGAVIIIEAASRFVGIDIDDPVCALDVNGPVRSASYLAANVPNAAAGDGQMINVIDPPAGQPRPYWSQDGEWRDAAGNLLAAGPSLVSGTITVTVGSAVLTSGATEWTQTVTVPGMTAGRVLMFSAAATSSDDENEAEDLDLAAIFGTSSADAITVTVQFRSPAAGPVKLNYIGV